MCEREPTVCGDRALEKREGAVDVLDPFEPLQITTALHVKVVGARHNRAAGAEDTLRIPLQPHVQQRRERCERFVLECQRVAGRCVDDPRFDLTHGLRIDQIEREPHGVRAPLDAPADHERCTKGLERLFRARDSVPSNVAERDDPQRVSEPLDACQIGCQEFNDAVAEGVGCGVVLHGGEGKDGNLLHVYGRFAPDRSGRYMRTT